MERHPRLGTAGASPRAETVAGSEPIDDLLCRSGDGDEAAFASLYDRIVPRVFGLALRVVRDRAQAEEVAQEAMLDLWRTASRFDPDRGSAISWILALTHRRAVDRIRSARASQAREHRMAAASNDTPYDEVSEQVVGRLEQQAVRRCLEELTDIQRESIELAYYHGYTYREVAALLSVALPAVKTRIRDGLIKLRDCVRLEP